MSWERKFHKIQTTATTQVGLSLDQVKEQLSDLGGVGLSEGLALCFFDHQVAWAKIMDGQVVSAEFESLEITYLQKARFFNAAGELLILRQSDGTYTSRLRRDGTGEEMEVLDDRQLLLGENTQTEADFSYLEEQAGNSGSVPVQLTPGKRAALVTRNYIEYAGNLLAGYVDTRLVGIEEVTA